MIVGWCMLIKRKIIERIGLLDERFIKCGFEDCDYCLRAREAGFRCISCGDIFIHHFGNRTFPQVASREITEKNFHNFILKWGKKGLEFLSYHREDFSGAVKE